MKYTNSNKPIVCMQKNSTCYKGTTTMTPKGVLWHSTGANNPNICRYVQPFETDDNYDEMIALLGKNRYGNDWNHKYRTAGMNCWIGKLADGTVATVQTMPWNYKPWGCGKGSKGSLNDTHMQFEICEDDLTSKAYFDAVYKEACEITAYYCQMYGLDPLGTFVYNGVTVPVITTHDESYDLKLGSNHGDPVKWLKKFGKTMNDARNDVAALMGKKEEAAAPAPTPTAANITLRTLRKGMSGEDVRALQHLLIGNDCSCGKYGADGSFGNDTESAVRKYNSQKKLKGNEIADGETWRSLLGV